MDAISLTTARAAMLRSAPVESVGPVNASRVNAAVTPVAPVNPNASQVAANRSMIVSRLVAGVVPGGVNFEAGSSNGTTAPSSAGQTQRAQAAAYQSSRAQPILQMYTHPADKNIAATGVHVGRSLDVTG
jgi:hypothetical protein